MSTIRLDIVTVERLVFSADVEYVSAPGIDGVLGILPHHAPLITALTEGELRYKKGNEELSFAIGGGFMEVRPEKVTVLADSAERADEIDEMRAQQARARAEQALKEKPASDVDAVRLERAVRRADIRLRVAKRRRSGREPSAGPEIET
ncbi:MAG: F0F1 ATP synthase subunit epsilon [Chloroflexi bacterium]|nr:F0F1 ATP synthase subunit epsilon [Chloroflexota bacterium]